MARARLSRSELKAQDEITTTLASFTETALSRKKEILIGAAILVALAGIWFGWRYTVSLKNAGAQAQLARAITAFQDPSVKVDKERFEKTIVEAQKTMKDYPSTQAASLAQYYLALSQEGLGDATNAVKNLEEVIGRGDAATKPIAQFALAGVYRRNGEPQRAVDVLKQLEAAGEVSKGMVVYELGISAEAANQKDVAQAAYSKIIKELPDSAFRTDAEGALKRMGLPVPVPDPTQIDLK